MDTVSFGPAADPGTFACFSHGWTREAWLAIADLIHEYFEGTKASSDERHVADIKTYLTGGWRPGK